MNNTIILEDNKVNIKIKLSALWITVMLLYIYGDFFTLFVPGRIESLMEAKMGVGTTTPIKLLVAAVVMAIPSMMVYLSLTLNPRINRLTNIILGIIYSLIMIITVISSIDSWKLFYTFLGIVEILITCLVVWNAWRWPKHKLLTIQ